MPSPGHFSLHSRAVPDLPADAYTVHVSQSIGAPGASPEVMDAFIEVTAPRYALPPNQVISTFPPNQSEGEFSTRLPQIVLKRRTLPWERELDGKSASSGLPREIPWLALVVLADAEGEFRAGRPIVECITPGVTLEGRNDVTTGNCIVVTQKVIQQVFPTKEELPLLAHVREVDLNDTELAGGDDDGWLAVVLANRLPQPGVRYRACLISLEGQYALLPDKAGVEEDPQVAFEHIYVYEEAALNISALAERSQGLLDGVNATSIQAGGPAPKWGGASPRAKTKADAWSAQTYRTGAAQKAAYDKTLPVKSGVGHAIGGLHGVDMAVIDPGAQQYIFPVLANWQFTCTGARDFQSLMQALDVAMLGSLPKPPGEYRVVSGDTLYSIATKINTTVDAIVRANPTLLTNGANTTLVVDWILKIPVKKPPAPRTRPLPEVLDTGHVSLAYTSRLGEPGTVWYRGPLTPRPTRREQPDDNGQLPLLHASDQARRVGPDGRENLSLAAAFEIGRLLALAEPSVVAAFLNWRKEGFEQARQAALLDKDALVSSLGQSLADFGFADRVGHALIADLGAYDAKRLGPVRPPVDPGLPIEAIDKADLVTLLAVGFQVPPAVVKDLLDPGVIRAGTVRAPVGQPITNLDELASQADKELAALSQAVLLQADAVAQQVLGRDIPGRPVPDQAGSRLRPRRTSGSGLKENH